MADEQLAAAQEAVLPPVPVDQDSLTLDELARAVVDRTVRPRAAAIRRLAEGVLERAGSKKPKKKDKPAKKGGKKRKLAKIPQSKAPE